VQAAFHGLVAQSFPNGQGESIEEAKQDLQAAIELLLEDREAEISSGLPPDAMRMPLQIG